VGHLCVLHKTARGVRKSVSWKDLQVPQPREEKELVSQGVSRGGYFPQPDLSLLLRGQKERQKTPELGELGIDASLYGGRDGSHPQQAIREVVETYWALPPEDFGDIQRPTAMYVTVSVIIGKKGWKLRCLVDSGASRNVIRTDIYEQMEREGLANDPKVVVPHLNDISGNRVKTGGGARLNIRISPRKEKNKVVVFKSDLANDYQMILGIPFLNRYCAVPLHRWMILYIGESKGQTPCVLGSLRQIIQYMSSQGGHKRRGVIATPRPPSLHGKKGKKGGSRKQPIPRVVQAPPRDNLSSRGPSTPKVSKPPQERWQQVPDPPNLKRGKVLRRWADAKLERVKKSQRGKRSRVLPRKGLSKPHTTTKKKEVRPRGISQFPLREKLHLMRVMAARQNRGVEFKYPSLEGLDTDTPDNLITDMMCAMSKEELRIPVFVSPTENEGGGMEVGKREVRQVSLHLRSALAAGEWLFEPTVRDQYAKTLCWPAVSLSVDKDGLTTFRAPVANPTNRRQWVKQWTVVGYVTAAKLVRTSEGQPLGAMETYEEYRSVRKDLNLDDPVVRKEHVEEVQGLMKERIGVDLEPDQMEKLMAVFEKHADIFGTVKGKAPPVSEIGKSKPFRINTEGAAPIAQKMYKRSPRAKREIERHIEGMEKDGVIEECESEWASPVVLAMKKDGGTRFCVNYRKVNDITVKDRYPLPRIDEILDQLGGKAFFTSFDMSAGYWSTPIAPEDKPKTAFISHKGLFRFNVMPFGLTNAPAAYQRAMDCVLAGLVGVSCLAYIDDVIIFSTGFDNHVRDIEAVLARLNRAGITISGRKSHVCSKELLYLGHIVTPEGVKPNPEKVAAVRDWEVPKTVKGVRAFLGIMNYYRRYIKDCGRVMNPLTALTAMPRKGEEEKRFLWTEKCQTAFLTLKQKLLEAPILRHPDFKRKFRIDVDSCKEGVGAVLTQKFEDGEHPVAYFSKKFSRDESKWGANELESIGVIKTLDHFRPYIGGWISTSCRTT
jgi:hypothetical protein